MARYKANTRSFIGNRLVEAGEEVEYDGVPGSNLDPLDEAAQAAVKGRGRDVAAPAAKQLVEIPADWQDLTPEQRINLARQLGAPVKGTTADKADKLIEAEIAKRAVV